MTMAIIAAIIINRNVPVVFMAGVLNLDKSKLSVKALVIFLT